MTLPSEGSGTILFQFPTVAIGIRSVGGKPNQIRNIEEENIRTSTILNYGEKGVSSGCVDESNIQLALRIESKDVSRVWRLPRSLIYT
jgi:hypothetical protein